MGRDAATLRQLAADTGFFNGPKVNYVGDGYTIPWQVALAFSLPIGYTLFTYKTYLDGLDLEASRLHDWLYTPYGSLIDVTRLEADNALYEELSHKSLTDAIIVYAAVRAGGTAYFGSSLTGFKGFDTITAGPNIAKAAPATRKAAAMPIKCVVVLQVVTTPGNAEPAVGYAPRAHIGGWTETHWRNSNDLGEATLACFGPNRPNWQPLCQARAALLPSNCSVIGVRFYQGGAGKGQFIARGFPGGFGTVNMPQDALLCRTNNPGANNQRNMVLRCLPDEVLVGGEYSPNNQFDSALKTYFDSLDGFYFYNKSYTNQGAIFNIDPTGLVQMAAAPTFAAGAILTVQGALDANGKKQSGQFVVNALVAGNKVQLAGWTFGACTGGTCYVGGKQLNAEIIGTTYPSVIRSVVRKIGRPFEQYRGRRSKHKVKP